MDRQEIIRMAREAGWSGLYMTYNEPTGKADWKMVKEKLTVPVTMEQIERFAALIAAAEREACAKLCINIEQSEPLSDRIGWEHGTVDCHAAIRARGEK